MKAIPSRRAFLATGAALGFGLAACTPEQVPNPSDSGTDNTLVETGQWLTGACMNNCSCGASRCLLKVYVENGRPVKIRTDEEGPDEEYAMQRRACPRGRAKINDYLSPARIKYPMKRVNWSPENPNGQLRGKDQWERISWEEALDYIAIQLKAELAIRGTRGMLCTAISNIGDSYFDPMVCLFNALGGAIHPEMGTVSFGSWPVVETLMCGGIFQSMPHPLEMAQSDLHVMFGCNWAANKAGNTALMMQRAKEHGGKIVIIDPWLNQTAKALADEWIPILPGTDTAFILGMAHYQITNGLFDQEFLDKYCVGFDAAHMPEGMPEYLNFKSYVMGELDGVPKTPEWAEAICHVPAETAKRLAQEIADTEKVNFFAGQSTSKIPAGEQMAQVFYTFALMHGGIGTPGNYMSSTGIIEGVSGRFVAGDATNAQANPVNPLTPAGFAYMYFPIINFDMVGDAEWDVLDFTELWESIANGAYGRDAWRGGKKTIDIHQIYFGGYSNILNSVPNVNKGIEVVRSMDFVWGVRPWFDTSAQYCDIVVPAATWWEKPSKAFSQVGEIIHWYDQIMDPIYEARNETEITEELAKRLGIDPKTVNTATDKERSYLSVRDAIVYDEAFQPHTVFTITQEDLDEMGYEGTPQEGITSFADFRKAGIFKFPRTKTPEQFLTPFMMYRMDPENNPLATTTGKFEICCGALAYVINTFGFSQIAPIGMYQPSPEQGQGAQTDEYPLLLWTPHTLRRAHTVNDSVMSLREAYPQECFISQVDADARGIKNGDIVLMTSPHGKVLRPAKVMQTIVPGAVALQDGAWFNIDEETGIDLGGNPNVLQAPHTSGESCTPWTGTLVQVEKYTGNLKLLPDKLIPAKQPAGIAE